MGLDSHGSTPFGQRRSQATLWPDSLRLLQVPCASILRKQNKKAFGSLESFCWCSRWNQIRTRSACFCDLSFDEFYMLVIGRIAGISVSPILWARTTNQNYTTSFFSWANWYCYTSAIFLFNDFFFRYSLSLGFPHDRNNPQSPDVPA